MGLGPAFAWSGFQRPVSFLQTLKEGVFTSSTKWSVVYKSLGGFKILWHNYYYPSMHTHFTIIIFCLLSKTLCELLQGFRTWKAIAPSEMVMEYEDSSTIPYFNLWGLVGIAFISSNSRAGGGPDGTGRDFAPVKKTLNWNCPETDRNFCIFRRVSR